LRHDAPRGCDDCIRASSISSLLRLVHRHLHVASQHRRNIGFSGASRARRKQGDRRYGGYSLRLSQHGKVYRRGCGIVT
jgi:hypothetical protein